MNDTEKNRDEAPQGSVIKRGVFTLTRTLYRLIGSSFIGRVMTDYRRADTLMHHGRRRTLRDDCRPMSQARLRVTEAVRNSSLFRSIGAFFDLLAHAPAYFYGMLLLFYGILNLLAYYVGPMLLSDLSFTFDRVILACVFTLLGFPLLFSPRPIPHLLVTGKLTRWFFVGLLGLPTTSSEPKISETAMRRFKVLSPYLAFVIAAACTVAGLVIPPLLIPGVILVAFVISMIFSLPESGVMLATATLPLVIWSTENMMVTAAVIAMTWISYGVKLLLMHRTIRFNLIDVAVLIFSVALGFSGLTGSYVSAESVWEGILCFVLFSLYFLITNLMTERKQIYRCLIGPAVSLAIVLLSAGIASLPSDLWSFLSVSRGGRVLRMGLDGLFSSFSGMAEYHDLCLPLMAIPLLGALLLMKRKTLRGCVTVAVALVLCLGGLYLYGSLSSMAVALIALALMLLLYSHKTLAVSILSLPLLACGGVWMYAYFGERINAVTDRIIAGQIYRNHVLGGAWRMICDHPAGIGLGSRPFAVLYPLYADAGYAAVESVPSLYMELMIYMGIPGLILFLFLIFLFMQKTFSCLKVSERSEDSAMVLGCVTSLMALLIFGLVSSYPSYFSVMLTAVILLGVCNALENVIYAEWDTTVAGMADRTFAVDRVFHAPQI